MSQRATKISNMGVSRISSYDDAWKLAAAFKKELGRLCDKYNYSAICYIGISENHSKVGKIHIGYRGKKEYINTPHCRREKSRSSNSDIIGPHLHIVLFSTPGTALRKRIRKYFKKRGYSFWLSKNFNSNVHRMLEYAMTQSRKYISTYKNLEQLPQDALTEFVKCAEHINHQMNGKKQIFYNLPLSRLLFHSNMSDLENYDCEVFTPYCLTPKAQKQYQSHCRTAYSSSPNSVYTTTELADDTHAGTKNSQCSQQNNPYKYNEVFTLPSSLTNSFHSTKKVTICEEYPSINNSRNHQSELSCNYNNAIGDRSNPSNKTYRSQRAHSPPIPQNIIDGLSCFLEALSPVGEIF